MKELGELVKTLVRPYIIITTWSVLLVMWYLGMNVPPILTGAGSAIAGEYIIERAIKRLSEREKT